MAEPVPPAKAVRSTRLPENFTVNGLVPVLRRPSGDVVQPVASKFTSFGGAFSSSVRTCCSQSFDAAALSTKMGREEAEEQRRALRVKVNLVDQQIANADVTGEQVVLPLRPHIGQLPLVFGREIAKHDARGLALLVDARAKIVDVMRPRQHLRRHIALDGAVNFLELPPSPP